MSVYVCLAGRLMERDANKTDKKTTCIKRRKEMKRDEKKKAQETKQTLDVDNEPEN